MCIERRGGGHNRSSHRLIGRDRDGQRLPDRAVTGVEVTAVGIGVVPVVDMMMPRPRHRGQNLSRNGRRTHLERQAALGRGRHEAGRDCRTQNKRRQRDGENQAEMRSTVHDADQANSACSNRG